MTRVPPIADNALRASFKRHPVAFTARRMMLALGIYPSHKFERFVELSANPRGGLVSDYVESFKKIGYLVERDYDGIHIHPKNKPGIKIIGYADNTLWTAAIVLGGEYNFTPSPAKKFVAIDIGANIGIASLYFANMDFVERIYAYEPFRPIFQQLLRNMRLNQRLAKKIRAFNYGLSGRKHAVSVSYNPKLPGMMRTIQDRFPGSGKIEKAELERASEILSRIFRAHPNSDIMLKIDCEGAEREILYDLAYAGLLPRVKIIIMEWHDGIFAPLAQILEAHGFKVSIYGEQPQYGTGMLRAERPG